MNVYLITKDEYYSREGILGYGYATYEEAKAECERLQALANGERLYYITQVEVK